MAQLCELLNHRFTQLGTYENAAGLFTPYNPDLCKTAASWPYTMQRNLATKHADPIERGKRIARYLRWAKRRFQWLVGYDCTKLDILIARAELGVTAFQAAALTLLAGERGNIGYDPIPKPVFQFPKDHAWHYNVLHEKWRFLCNFYADQEPLPFTFTFEITRKPLVPQKFWGVSGGASNMVMVYQFMLALPGETSQNTVEVDGAWQIDAVETVPFFVGGGDAFQIRSIRTDGVFFPIEVVCRDVAMDVKFLITAPSQTPTTRAGNPAEHSYAWERTEIVNGRVESQGQKYLVRNGTGWLEHQLGYEPEHRHAHASVAQRAIMNLTTPPTDHRLWVLLQLDDGSVLTCSTNKAIKGPVELPVDLTTAELTAATGKTQYLRGTVLVDRYSESPLTGTWYPLGYRLDFPDAFLTFTVSPLLETGMFNADPFDVEYFQTGCLVSGSRLGTGFGTCHGYVPHSIRTKSHLTLLDFKVTDALLQEFASITPTVAVQFASVLVFTIPILILALIVVNVLKSKA